MKRLGIGALATLVAACCGLAAVATPSAVYAQRNIGKAVVAQDQAPAPDFGSPPSGSIPILYNDHHVYAKPDTLRNNRVLAALVRNGTVLIPLRSMFEQMGASVAYDPSTQTVTVSEAGAQVQVTVGRPVVVINGESRPLDVPPIMWHGTVLVPVRVISEGMGAYVQWVPDQHVVVVRYIPPTPPPAPAPPPTSAPAPPPPPPPPARPNPFVVNGYLRTYYFTRENASNNPGEQYSPAKYNYNAINQASFEAALSAHAAYNFMGGFTLGATYLFADPLGACDLVTNQTNGSPCILQKPPNVNPDDTLPGYQLATLYEAYAQYAGSGLFVRAGNQVINTPWANASDSRVKPVAFQGADISYTLGPWTIEGMDMVRFQSRTSSFFTQTTLLTSYPPTGNSGLPGNYTPPGNVKFASNDPFGYIPTDGFQYGRLGYSAHGLSGDVDYYAIENIADMLWIDGRYGWQGSLHPFLAFQLGNENNAGQSVIGKINSQLFGVQAGFNVMPAVQLIGSYDELPWKSDSITLPTGVKCSSTTHLLSLPTPANGYAVFPYFIPNNAPQCVPGATPGTAQILYGGWASPYTDSYATDPMFTTEMTQGVADRHIAGNSLKFALVFTSADHRFVGQISHAQYNAGNIGGNETSSENNIDALYYLNRVIPGHRYTGFLFHYRYGERFFNETAIYGGLPVFKYNRAQIEYDF